MALSILGTVMGLVIALFAVWIAGLLIWQHGYDRAVSRLDMALTAEHRIGYTEGYGDGYQAANGKWKAREMKRHHEIMESGTLTPEQANRIFDDIRVGLGKRNRGGQCN